MSDKFLNSSVNSINLTNGTVEIYASSLGATNLSGINLLRSNGDGKITNSTINETDIKNLEAESAKLVNITNVQENVYTEFKGDIKTNTGNLNVVGTTHRLEGQVDVIGNLYTIGDVGFQQGNVDVSQGDLRIVQGDINHLQGDIDNKQGAIKTNLFNVSSGTEMKFEGQNEFTFVNEGSGEMVLNLKADINNINETWVPIIKFWGDGSNNEGSVGLNNNTLVIGNSVDVNGGIDFKCGGIAGGNPYGEPTRMFIKTNGNTQIYEQLEIKDSLTINPNNYLNIGSEATNKASGLYGAIGYDGSIHTLNIYGGMASGGTTRRTLIEGNVSITGTGYISGTDGTMSGVNVGEEQLFVRHHTNATAGWWQGCQTSAPSTIDNDYYFEVVFSDGSKNTPAYIQDSVGGAPVQMNFTAQHRSYPNFTYDEKLVGRIVCSSGKYRNFITADGKVSNNSSITINDCLPIVELCNEEKAKNCFGVISSEEEKTRKYDGGGNFMSILRKQEGDKRLHINGLGEGGLWVSNINGDIENGDFLTSYLEGYAQKQDDDILRNYTVAKATMSCNFNPQDEKVMKYGGVDADGNMVLVPYLDEEGNEVYEPKYKCLDVEINGIQQKIAFIGVVYKCS